jgi:fructose-specific component phosphotransferase system IIB-like protein
MTTLIAYTKSVDQITTHTLRLPIDAAGASAGQEIAELLDGRTIVVLFGTAQLPADQPAAIADSIEPLTSPSADMIAAIKQASPHVALINQRIEDAIGERYSIANQIKLIRTAPSAEMTAFDAYAEECRAWGRSEKAKLGL